MFPKVKSVWLLFALAACVLSMLPGSGALAAYPDRIIKIVVPFDRLNKAAAHAVKADAFKKLSANEGLVLVASPRFALDGYFREEEERWRKVIQEAGIKSD